MTGIEERDILVPPKRNQSRNRWIAVQLTLPNNNLVREGPCNYQTWYKMITLDLNAAFLSPFIAEEFAKRRVTRSRTPQINNTYIIKELCLHAIECGSPWKLCKCNNIPWWVYLQCDPDAVKFMYIYRLSSTYSWLPPRRSNVAIGNEETLDTFSKLAHDNHLTEQTNETFTLPELLILHMDHASWHQWKRNQKKRPDCARNTRSVYLHFSEFLYSLSSSEWK